ncbi:MAG: hypothetical protein CUN53_01265 [Phototrophicales bacterium]|nr:MAG: hypothetical protein CUN53_01265 [Phototrophicales bacterium]
MTSWRTLRNRETGALILPKARWCASFWCHFKGLQFRSRLPEDEGLLFVFPKASRSNTTIHMFFVFFQIGVVWLDASGQVVDKTLAKPWRPMYAPRAPAQFFIEANPSILDRVNIGDSIRFDDV